MEKKKLLLVAISVGIFLALTIGAAILFFAPKDVLSSSMASGRTVQAVDTGINAPSPSSLDPVELVRQPKEVPGLQQAPQGTSRQGDGFHISGSGGGSGKSAETLISVPKPSTAAVPDAAPAGRAVSTPVQQTASKSTTSAVSKPAATAASKPAATATSKTDSTAVPATAQAAPKTAAPATVAAQTQAKPASTQTQAKPPSTQTKVYNDYWVQTGAFSTISRAEVVKNALSSKGITSIIENREVEGRTVFRVRVGPYTSQNEANYWLSLIKSINGFEDSQVRQTQSHR